MDKQQAQNIIKETFENPFQKDRFAGFVKNLLNRIEDAPFTYHGNLIPDSYKPYVSKYERIGKYHDGENRIDILIVHLNRKQSIERARTMQRNFVAGYLQGKYGSSNDKEAAIAAFVSPGEADWRFSLVKMDYRFEEGKSGKVKVKEEFTPARRWSFLVGSNEASHTAQSRLVPILADDENNPTLARLEDAFNIETVTKEFFLKYRELFIRTKEALDEVVAQSSRLRNNFEAKGVDTVDFAKKLLGQIVFLYFLQKKGWFGVGRDEDWGGGSKQFLREIFKGTHGTYSNFFNDILEPLFYEALRIDRRHDDDYYSRFNCKIPFLNGGLFDPIGNYDWVHTDILLPNELFSNTVKTKEGDTGNGILDIFDRYNFTVKEDEPLEKDVAIDPELLGKTYEKFNAIRPDNFEEYKAALKSGKKGAENKFNKKFGVYYTPREIVHYMCQQSLIHHLDTALNKDAAAYEELGTKQFGMFGNETKSQLGLMVEHRPSQPIPKEDIETLIKLGERVGENEAAVQAKGGETRTYAYKLPQSIRSNAQRIDEALATITVCDPAIGSGAFPVGMMHEIVKTRNVLSAFIEDPKRTIYHFKRECIEKSLYGVDIDPGAVEIAKLRLWLSLVVDEEDIRQIKPLPNLDYKIVCGNSLLGLPDIAMKDLQLEAEIEQLKIAYFNETNPTNKKQLRDNIDQAFQKLVQSAKEYGSHILDTDFDFKIHFSEVFHEKSGFDVVIGNPPYIRQEQIKEYKASFQSLYRCYSGVADIYVYFYERGLQLLRRGGVLTFITSNKYMRAGYGEKLRHFLGANATILELIDFGDAPVFEATAYPSIIILQKEKPENSRVRASNWQRETPVAEFEGKVNAISFLIAQRELTADGWRIESPAVLRLLEKVRNAGVPLGEHVNGRFYRGIITGLNEGFVVDRTTRDRLIAEHPSSAEVLKPFLRGRDVKRWRVDFAERYLIKIESSENKKHPWSGANDREAERVFAQTCPAIHAHFEEYRERLMRRDDQGKYFWELRSCKYWQEFEQPKIIYPDIAQRAEFCFDSHVIYMANTLYFIPTNEIRLTGLLNSRLIFWFYTKLSSQIRGDFVRYFTQFVSQIPIATDPQTNRMEQLVDQIFMAKENNRNADVSDLEREIDQIVYQLYGLTQDEIKTVEDSL